MPLRSPTRIQSKNSEGESGQTKSRSFGRPLKSVRKVIKKLKVKSRRQRGKQSSSSSGLDFDHQPVLNKSQLVEKNSAPEGSVQVETLSQTRLVGRTVTAEQSAQHRIPTTVDHQVSVEGDNRTEELLQNSQDAPPSSFQVKAASPRTKAPPRRYSGGSKMKVCKRSAGKDVPAEDPSVSKMYEGIPLLEATKLPRGGISIETDAVGRVQVSLYLSTFTVS